MSRLCRLRNASHGDDGQWAYSEIVGLREQVEFWQKEAAGRRDDMANYTRIVSETIDRLNVEVSKLTKERDDLRSRRCEVCGYLEHEREHTGCLREQLAALAEQNAKMRKAFTKWRYLDSSYNWRCGHCGNEVEDGHKEGCALSLPDLASPVLNRIRAEGMRMAADYCTKNTLASAHSLAVRLRDQAAELEKTNG